MSDIVASVAVALGTVFCLLSAIGIARMPDVYIRLQVASKASSLGVALLMLGVAAHFGEMSITVRALLVVAFLFLTAPVAAHVIGRAAYLAGVPLATGSEPDELAGRYDAETGRLAGTDAAADPDADAGTDPAADPDADAGTDPAADPDADPDADEDPDEDPAADPDADAGEDPDADASADVEASGDGS